jgi:hypothetical protein
MKKRYAFRVWTGPTRVVTCAEDLRGQGIDVLDGTEHVYGSVDAPTSEAAQVLVVAALRNTGHSGFNLSDVHVAG